MTMIQSFPYLFDSFDRFVGNPLQQKIHSFPELQHFITANNGIHPCFVTLNSFQNDATVCRTIFNDFDACFNMTCKFCGEVIKESENVICKCGNTTQFIKESEEIKNIKRAEKIKQAQKLAGVYNDYHIPYVPHYTAEKGVHILPLFLPQKFNDSDLITNLFYFFINESKSFDKVDLKICKSCGRTVEGTTCICGSTLFKTQSFKVPHADTVVVPDLRRLIRLPSKRTNGLNCIAIPPEDFINMQPEEMFQLARTPRQSVPVKQPTMKMSDFKFKPVDLDQFQTNKTSHDYAIDSTRSSLSEDVKLFLETMFPHGCLRTQLATLEPRDEIRSSAVIHMKKIGIAPIEAIDFLSKLGWRDYEYSKTAPRVWSIFQSKKCERFPHKKMKNAGLCNKKECKFR
ncbi:MAG: hypothetical protein WC623_22120 [Pedobacter sp.]|uniref:hypothetical protein n=1 Tax=Pedobacter sp. TaxID=1411316 RepID=UPI00356B30E9